jgi:hypothetical protein
MAALGVNTASQAVEPPGFVQHEKKVVAFGRDVAILLV